MSVQKFRLVLLSLGSCKGRRGRDPSPAAWAGQGINNSLNSLAKIRKFGMGERSLVPSSPQNHSSISQERNQDKCLPRGAWSCSRDGLQLQCLPVRAREPNWWAGGGRVAACPGTAGLGAGASQGQEGSAGKGSGCPWTGWDRLQGWLWEQGELE